jgi:XTP/dITP diphosphohydrolase
VTSRLLIATTNRGKQREFRRLLDRLPAVLVTPDELGIETEVEEPHDTYAGNATVKAAAYGRASGIPTLADDSGIEVAALGWGPGVRSARWGSGAASQAAQLVDALRGQVDRRARMVCALALAIPGDPEPSVEVFTGVVEGSVADEPRGKGGFGYDPIFLLPEGRTTAELPESEKDRISHRGRAVAAAWTRMLEVLRSD